MTIEIKANLTDFVNMMNETQAQIDDEHYTLSKAAKSIIKQVLRYAILFRSVYSFVTDLVRTNVIVHFVGIEKDHLKEFQTNPELVETLSDRDLRKYVKINVIKMEGNSSFHNNSRLGLALLIIRSLVTLFGAEVFNSSSDRSEIISSFKKNVKGLTKLDRVNGTWSNLKRTSGRNGESTSTENIWKGIKLSLSKMIESTLPSIAALCGVEDLSSIRLIQLPHDLCTNMIKSRGRKSTIIKMPRREGCRLFEVPETHNHQNADEYHEVILKLYDVLQTSADEIENDNGGFSLGMDSDEVSDHITDEQVQDFQRELKNFQRLQEYNESNPTHVIKAPQLISHGCCVLIDESNENIILAGNFILMEYLSADDNLNCAKSSFSYSAGLSSTSTALSLETTTNELLAQEASKQFRLLAERLNLKNVDIRPQNFIIKRSKSVGSGLSGTTFATESSDAVAVDVYTIDLASLVEIDRQHEDVGLVVEDQVEQLMNCLNVH